MSREYRYFKVNGGVVRAAYDRWLAKRNEQTLARMNVKAEFGAQGTYGSNQGLVGLVFEKKKGPFGWVNVPGQPTVFKPTGHSKEGRETKKRFAALKLNDVQEFQTEVLGGQFNPFAFMDGMSCRFMGCEFIGETLILLVPLIEEKPMVSGGAANSAAWQPPDEHTFELKNSEYWQLKEQQQEQPQAEAKASEVGADKTGDLFADGEPTSLHHRDETKLVHEGGDKSPEGKGCDRSQHSKE